MEDPKLIDSDLSQSFIVDGHRFEVEIYRLEDTKWTLEVVDETRASTVWDEEFDTDEAALTAFHEFIDAEGAAGILNQEPVSAI